MQQRWQVDRTEPNDDLVMVQGIYVIVTHNMHDYHLRSVYNYYAQNILFII